MACHKTDTPTFPPVDSRSRGVSRLGEGRADPRRHRVLPAAIPAMMAMFLAAGCEEDPPPPEETPPDLTGTYELVSLKQGSFPPVGPPDANGTFTVRQTSVMGQEASGTVVLKITIVTPPVEIDADGTYKNRHDGSWEQEAGDLQTKGSYTLANDTLTVIVTEPPSAVSTTIWKR